MYDLFDIITPYIWYVRLVLFMRAMNRITSCNWSKQNCLAGKFHFDFGYSVWIDAIPVVGLISRRIGQKMLNSFVMKRVKDYIKKYSRKK